MKVMQFEKATMRFARRIKQELPNHMQSIDKLLSLLDNKPDHFQTTDCIVKLREAKEMLEKILDKNERLLMEKK